MRAMFELGRIPIRGRATLILAQHRPAIVQDCTTNADALHVLLGAYLELPEGMTGKRFEILPSQPLSCTFTLCLDGTSGSVTYDGATWPLRIAPDSQRSFYIPTLATDQNIRAAALAPLFGDTADPYERVTVAVAPDAIAVRRGNDLIVARTLNSYNRKGEVKPQAFVRNALAFL